MASDETLLAVRDLADASQIVWHRKTRKGFFLPAEDSPGYVKRLAQMRAELECELSHL